MGITQLKASILILMGYPWNCVIPLFTLPFILVLDDVGRVKKIMKYGHGF